MEVKMTDPISIREKRDLETIWRWVEQGSRVLIITSHDEYSTKLFNASIGKFQGTGKKLFQHTASAHFSNIWGCDLIFATRKICDDAISTWDNIVVLFGKLAFRPSEVRRRREEEISPIRRALLPQYIEELQDSARKYVRRVKVCNDVPKESLPAESLRQ